MDYWNAIYRVEVRKDPGGLFWINEIKTERFGHDYRDEVLKQYVFRDPNPDYIWNELCRIMKVDQYSNGEGKEKWLSDVHSQFISLMKTNLYSLSWPIVRVYRDLSMSGS